MADRDLTLPSLGARMRGAARGSGLTDFWNWWRGQLDPLLPQSLRTAVARRRMRPVVSFAGDHATLWRPAVEGKVAVMRPVATIPLAPDPAVHAADGSTALTQGADRASARRIVVSLPASDVLRRRLTLPLALEESLRQAIAYDLDRHTPFRPDQLYFDAAVVERSQQRGTMVVELASARRAIVDPLLRHVAAWGGEVVAVVPEPPATAVGSRLNLLPLEQRTTGAAWKRWQFWVPLVAIVAALVAAVAIPLWNERQDAIALGLEADESRARAAVSETLRAELNAKVADYNFALERKYAYPSALAILDQVSKILPDDTWLTQFELKTSAKGKDIQREIMLRGETANVGKLVQVLEESQMFTQAAQRGTTTKIQPGPGEIFDLGAQLRPRPAPATRNVAVGGGTDGAAPAGAPATVGAPATRPPGAMAPTTSAPTTPATTIPATTIPATTIPATPAPTAPVAAPSPAPATSGPTAGSAPGAVSAAPAKAAPVPLSDTPVKAVTATTPGASAPGGAPSAGTTAPVGGPSPGGAASVMSPGAMAPAGGSASVPGSAAVPPAATGTRREGRP